MAERNIVVKINGNHDGIIKSFNAASAEAKKFGAATGKTADQIEADTKRIAKETQSFIKSAAKGYKHFQRQIREIPEEGKAMHAAMAKYLRETGKEGKSTANEIISYFKKVDPALAKILAEAQATSRKATAKNDAAKKIQEAKQRVRELVGEMKGFSGQFGEWGKQIDRELNQPLGEARTRANQIVNELSDIPGIPAEKLAEAIERAEKATRRANFDAITNDLKDGTKQAALLSRMIGEEFKSETLKAQGGIDALLAKTAKMGPGFEAAATRFRKAWNVAADSAHKSLGDAINVLRMGGPEGEKAADEIVHEFQTAGKLSKAALSRIFAPLDKANVDAKMLPAMKSIETAVGGTVKKTETMWSKMGQSAKFHLLAIGSSYLGIQQAVSGVTQALQEQDEVITRIRDKHMDVAKAQADAQSNFSGLTPAERKDLREVTPFEMQRKYGLTDEGLTSAIRGGGIGVSAGGKVPLVKNALSVAARMNQFDQGNIGDATGGLVSVANALGLKGPDAAERAQSFMLETKQLARLEKDADITAMLPKVLTNAALNAAPGKGTQSASELASMFTMATQLVNDKLGKPTATNMVTLDAKMAQYFRKIPGERDKIQGEIRDVNRVIDDATAAKLASANQGITDIDRLVASQTTKARRSGKAISGPVMSESQRIRREKLVADRKKYSTGRFVSDANKRKLEDLNASLESFKVGGVDIDKLDPGSAEGRRRFIARHGKHDQFIDVVGMEGEQIYRELNRKLLTQVGSIVDPETFTTMPMRQRQLGKASESPDAFNDYMREVTTNATPQMLAALQTNRARSSRSKRDATDTSKAFFGVQRDAFNEYMEDTGGEGLSGFGRRMAGRVGTRAFAATGGPSASNVLIDGLNMLSTVAERNRNIWGGRGPSEMGMTEAAEAARGDDAQRVLAENIIGQAASGQFSMGQLQRTASATKFNRGQAQIDANLDGRIDRREQLQLDLLADISTALQEQMDYMQRTASAAEETAGNTGGTNSSGANNAQEYVNGSR